MSFGIQDATAILQTLNGNFQAAPVPGTPGLVIHLQVMNINGLADPAERLAALMEACARWGKDGDQTTVWVEVVGPAQLLGTVQAASARLKSYGIGLIVSHGQDSTHLPGGLLPLGLRQAVQAVERTGQLWHPIAKELVYAEQ